MFLTIEVWLLPGIFVKVTFEDANISKWLIKMEIQLLCSIKFNQKRRLTLFIQITYKFRV